MPVRCCGSLAYPLHLRLHTLNLRWSCCSRVAVMHICMSGNLHRLANSYPMPVYLGPSLTAVWHPLFVLFFLPPYSCPPISCHILCFRISLFPSSLSCPEVETFLQGASSCRQTAPALRVLRAPTFPPDPTCHAPIAHPHSQVSELLFYLVGGCKSPLHTS